MRVLPAGPDGWVKYPLRSWTPEQVEPYLPQIKELRRDLTAAPAEYTTVKATLHPGVWW